MPPLREQEKVSRHIKELQEQTKKLEQIYEQKIKDLDELKKHLDVLSETKRTSLYLASRIRHLLSGS